MSKLYYNLAVEGPFYLKSAKIQYKIQNTIYDLYHRKACTVKEVWCDKQIDYPHNFSKTRLKIRSEASDFLMHYIMSTFNLVYVLNLRPFALS